MRTALYIRVSTEEQAKEGYSIRAQTERLKAYCVSQGWEVVDFYIDDGKSAKDMNRANLKRMLKHIEQGLIECVLVYRLDRLTRSVLDLYKLLEIFDKHNCKFKSATEVYDTTTAMGRMFITIVAALAQWERENLSERVRMGMEQKAREGQWVINVPPYGYELDKANKTLVINQEEAETVKKIYDLYLSGKGMKKISTFLNQSNITTKSGKTWNDFKIGYILDNPLYIGTMRYNYRVNKEQYFELENAVPPIVDVLIYEKVQKVRNGRSVSHPKAATSKFIFSGFTKCGKCGGPISGKYGYSKRKNKIHRPRSYYCANQSNGLCDQRNMSERFIEHQFLKYLENIHIDNDLLQDISNQEEVDDVQNKIDLFKKELDTIEARRKKWQYAWVNEMLNDDDFSKRMNEESRNEEEVKTQLSSLQPSNKILNRDELVEVLKDVRKNWEHMESLEKKMLLQMIVKKIIVDKVSPRPKVESVKILDVEFY
jgi:site-specific DNA recombinase